MGNFKRGLFFGGLVGAALMWLNVTPKGKEMRDKLMIYADDLFVELKQSIKQLEGPTREMYDALVERAVEEYGDKMQLAQDVKLLLVRRRIFCIIGMWSLLLKVPRLAKGLIFFACHLFLIEARDCHSIRLH